VDREVGTLRECTVGCTLGDGVGIGVRGTLVEVVGACWGCVRMVSGVIKWVPGRYCSVVPPRRKVRRGP
jgi:hypothetical protein